jgi:hypothetical protein
VLEVRSRRRVLRSVHQTIAKRCQQWKKFVTKKAFHGVRKPQATIETEPLDPSIAIFCGHGR